jgi:hypothetical protein
MPESFHCADGGSRTSGWCCFTALLRVHLQPGRLADFASAVNGSVSRVLIFSFLLSAWMIGLAYPAVDFIFLGGSFHRGDSVETAYYFAIFAVSLFSLDRPGHLCASLLRRRRYPHANGGGGVRHRNLVSCLLAALPRRRKPLVSPSLQTSRSSYRLLRSRSCSIGTGWFASRDWNVPNLAVHSSPRSQAW